MANKVSNFSDLIQRVTAICLLHPLGSARYFPDTISAFHSHGNSDVDDHHTYKTIKEPREYEEDEEKENAYAWNEVLKKKREEPPVKTEKLMEMEMMMGEVFKVVLSMKKAYVSLPDANSPWDLDKMRRADMAVVAELRRLGILKERFSQSMGHGGGSEWRGRRVVGVHA